MVWINSLGLHNVNGTINTFPDNPQSFGNSRGDAGWTYTFVFNISGEYSYRCDVDPDIMIGYIIVSDAPVSAGEVEEPNHFDFYPNPVRNKLHWKWNKNSSPANAHIQIYDVTGKLVDSFNLGFETYKDVSNWTEDLYIYTITTDSYPVEAGKLFIIK